MSKRIGVVVPSPRIARPLGPLIIEAESRNIPVVEDVRDLDVAVGLDGFLPPAKKRLAVDNWFDCWTHPPHDYQTQAYMSGFHREQHARLWDSAVWGPLVGWLGARPLPEVKRDFAAFFLPKTRVPCDDRRGLTFLSYTLRAFFLARRVARAQGLRFVVKTRDKIGCPFWLRCVPGVVVLGEEIDSLALLSMSRWCVHFGSAAAFEAAYAGAYAYWYPAPEDHLRHLPGTALRPGMFSWPGVSRMGTPGDDGIASWERTAYLKHYLGDCDGKAAARVLDIAEQM